MLIKKSLTTVALLASLLGASAAFAHAHLKSAEPAADSSVSAPAIMLVSGGSVADLETVLTLDVTELMLGVSRGTPAKVVYELENALHAMKADGSYQRIFRRWFPSETPPRHVVRVGVQPH